MKRQCLHADASMTVGTLYVIARVTEGVAGFEVVHKVKSLPLAVKFSDATNAAAGLTADDIWTIRLSATLAGPVVARGPLFDANTAERADHTPDFAKRVA